MLRMTCTIIFKEGFHKKNDIEMARNLNKVHENLSYFITNIDKKTDIYHLVNGKVNNF